MGLRIDPAKIMSDVEHRKMAKSDRLRDISVYHPVSGKDKRRYAGIEANKLRAGRYRMCVRGIWHESEDHSTRPDGTGVDGRSGPESGPKKK